MKAKELRQLSEGELLIKEKELGEELFNLRFQHATGQLDNVMRIPQVKRDFARVKTILKEKAPDKGKVHPSQRGGCTFYFALSGVAARCERPLHGLPARGR